MKNPKSIISVLAVLFFVFLAMPVAIAGEDAVLGPDEWPVTVDAAVVDIVAGLKEEDKETLRNTKREELIRYHHGWGTGIRNHYGLWRGNEELIKSACDGNLCHPDDASMVIIEKVWETLQK